MIAANDTNLFDFLTEANAYYNLTQTLPTNKFDQRVTVCDLQTISRSQLYSLGFANWDGSLVLLPLWALGLIKHGEILTSISGDTVMVGKDYIDDDTRGGAIAFGFYPLTTG